jgi:hypothetical protein
MRLSGFLFAALAVAGCQAEVPPAVEPPPDPPSGEFRPDEPIPYDTLVEHLRFNTKSRVQLLGLRGQVLRVRGPVWRVERDGEGGVLRMGTERGSYVRARFTCSDDLQDIRPGQDVDVVGVFAFDGTTILLDNPSLMP